MEGVHLNTDFGAFLTPSSWRLATLYAGAPLVALLCGLGLTLDFTLSLKSWGERHDDTSPQRHLAVWASLPVALGVFALSLAFILSLYPKGPEANRGLVAYFWLLPCALIAGYVWHIASVLLTRLNLASARPSSLIIAVALSASPLLIGALALPSAIIDLVLSWPTVGLLLALLLIAFGVALSLLTPDHVWLDRLTRRLALAGLALGVVGVVDLSDEMGKQRIIKEALLDHTLMSGALLQSIQPLFDQDGDGVAGKLGGGDCDDQNPNIYPGAQEIPLNGIDEDCHEGDALPPEQPRLTRRSLSVRSPNQGTSRRPKRPNIVLISIDTLRADHLHYLGYARKTSPFLDELSLRGLTFEWAFATGAQTRISMPAVFTGRYCSELSRSKADWARIYADNVTLAERLSAAGYHTVGIPAHNYFNHNYGLSQGFIEWNFSVVQRLKDNYEGDQRNTSYHKTGELVTEEAIKWADQRVASRDRQPFFMWLHYFDPHEIYRDHAEYDFGKHDIDLYDEEIRYTDAQLERLFSSIEALPFAEDTYFIIHSDHGEAFGDHGSTHHGKSLFNEETRVPLMVIGPGLPPRKIKTPVSLIDVTPTILDLVGVAPSPPEPRGVSLLPFASQPDAPHPPVVIEMLEDSKHSARRALIDWPWKLHYSISFQNFHLYDLSKDAREEVDRAANSPRTLERLDRRLKRFLSEETTPMKPSNRSNEARR